MKILVDEMPKTATECPYCKDKNTMDYEEYICMWSNLNLNCEGVYGMNKCPFFTDKRKGE